MPPMMQVDASPVRVAHRGAPSQPIAGAVPSGQVAPGGVAIHFPHASWCTSTTV